MKLYRYKLILSLLFLLFVSVSVSAQETEVIKRNLKGVVIDENKNPLEGVSFGISEDLNSKVTAADGKFSVELGGNSIVIFQKRGYETARLKFDDLLNSQVVLKKSPIEAGENDDVFIPFSTRKKREITGAISTIKGSELPNIPLSVLNNSLAGRLPGLYVQQTSTQPGGDNASFLVRAQSTFSSARQNPLVLVDGAIRDFSDMDATEIESISILKDAASLAWYGVRGADGVILVTTRRGSDTKTQITFDATSGVQLPENFTKTVSASTFANLYNEASTNGGGAAKYDQAALDSYQSGSDPYKYPNNDYIGRFINNASLVQRYVATISGGNSVAKYFTLVSFFNQNGLFNETDQSKYSTNTAYKRYNIRTNVDLAINKNLDVTLDVGGRAENRLNPEDGLSTVLNRLYTTPSNAFPILNANGTYGGTSLYQYNPLAMFKDRGFSSEVTRVLLASITGKYKLDELIKGLSANIYYSYDVAQAYNSGRSKTYEVYELNPTTNVYSRFGTKSRLVYSSARYGAYDSRVEFWSGFDYKRSFGEHSINANLRYQQSSRHRPNVLDNKSQGMAMRVLYSLENKYYAEAVTSYSGTENFKKGNRFFWYPAISAGWVVSEENFLNGIKPISYLKLRGSYGFAGNEGTIDRRFAYNDLWNRSSGGGFPFGTSFTAGPTATELTLGNPLLLPERTEKTNFGFDSKFFNQTLSITADVFNEKRTNILTDAITPLIIGQSLVKVNEGSAQYKGFELSAEYSNNIGKLNFSLFGNATFVKSKILNLNESDIPDYQTQIGFPVSNRRVLIAEGIFTSPEEINSHAVQQFSRSVAPGDIKYKDTNNDGFINGLDVVTTSYTDLPTAYFSFGLKASFRGFDLSALFQGIEGRTIDINGIINQGNNNNGYINQFSIDRWTSATAATAKYPRLIINDRGNNTQSSTYWLRSGDYLRLKSIEFGYSLPERLTNKLNINGCRFYISGFNLLTFKELSEDIDPEIPGAGFGSAYPYLKTVSLGLNLKF